MLAKNPNIGHQRVDLTSRPDVLFWPVRSYLILYRPSPTPLEILRVLHGRRDVRGIFGPTDLARGAILYLERELRGVPLQQDSVGG